jgi:DNA-binding LacI/PurR family transcriptional regulator
MNRPSRKKKHLTIVDIARRAGVAPMSVSRVINKNGYVSEQMREKVLKVVKESNYHPNALARSLRSQRTQVIGVLLPDIINPFSAELVRGIQEVLLPEGYSFFISTSERSVAREQSALRAFFEHRADGLIVATRETKETNDFLVRLAEPGMPMVVVGRLFNHPRVDHVTADHWKGGYEAVEHLISLGHQSIGFIGVSLVNGAGLRRFRGYLDALRDNKLRVNAKLIVGPDRVTGPDYSTQDDGYEAMKRLLAQRKRPTAILGRNDFTAMGAMYAIRDAGLSVPDDIAIVGFDNVPLSAYTTPPLTTVDQTILQQGREAARLILERITGDRSRERREICLECNLIIRESTQSKAVRGAARLSSA